MNVVLSSVKKGHAIEPYKYYAWPEEHIFYCEEDNSFLHRASDNRIIFKSNNFKDNFFVKDHGDFDTCFYKMTKCQHQDKLFDVHLEYLKVNYRKKPVIIGGCGRSGTTLLLAILGAHKNIHAFDEELYAFYPHPYRLRNLVDRLRHVDFDKRWCEKTPKNIMVFRDIYNLFNGNVKLIHIVRDGRDVVTSVHPFHKGQYWVDVKRWVEDVTVGLSCSDIAFLVKYEDLVIYPEDTLRKICDYIKEPFEESLLNFTLKTTVKDNPAFEKGAQNIHSNNIHRWQLDQHKERISEFYSNVDAKNLVNKLGYEV